MAISLTLTYPKDPERHDYKPFSYFGKWVDSWRPIVKSNNLQTLWDAVELGAVLVNEDVPLLIEELKQVKIALLEKQKPDRNHDYLVNRINLLVPFLEGLDLSEPLEVTIG